jgi:hypothetical protein
MAIVVATLVLLAPAQGAAEGPCSSDTVSARMESQVVSNQFTDPNPTWRERVGLPRAIQSITWLREPAICTVALRRLRRVVDSLGWGNYSIRETTRVLVFAVEPDLYVVFGDGNPNMLFFFTRRWRHVLTAALAS